MDVTGLGDLVTLAEAAQRLRRSTKQVRRMIDAGQLRKVQFSRRGQVLIPASDLDRLIAECISTGRAA